MNKIVYLDCPTGISGDMCLGALVHLGVPLDYLSTSLNQLGIAAEYTLRREFVHHNGQQATKFHVDLGSHSHPHPPSRHLPTIQQLIQTANLPVRVTTWSLAIFQRLAEAEAAVHGISIEQVHFHEVGATDAIVDVVGTCLGLDWLGIDQIFCSALPTGGGTVSAAHGRLPVPAPATLKLFEMGQIPLYSNGIEQELVTPTGAAIATTLATRFGPPPAMVLDRVGLGAGSHQLAIPNILRLWLGESSQVEVLSSSPTPRPSQPVSLPPVASVASSQQTIALLETQIDDLSPQAIGYVFDALFAAGALDVFTQPISMKKSRPGVLLTVICAPEQVTVCEAILFQETTTLGIRRLWQQRSMLQREIHSVETVYGSIQIKLAWLDQTGQKPVTVQPEYEDCARIAREHNLPWREVHRLALETWYSTPKKSI